MRSPVPSDRGRENQPLCRISRWPWMCRQEFRYPCGAGRYVLCWDGGHDTCGLPPNREECANMSILGWIVLGALAGWLASVLVRGSGLGLLVDIVVGIVGALLGGYLVTLLGGTGITGFNLWSFVVAVAGAIVLLLIVHLVTRGRRAPEGWHAP